VQIICTPHLGHAGECIWILDGELNQKKCFVPAEFHIPNLNALTTFIRFFCKKKTEATDKVLRNQTD